MAIDYDKYETIVGLEIHTQLLTKSKAYCADSTEYGASPNSNISPISLGHPGTLPVANQKVVEYAVRLGVALQCDIRSHNEYARKNYFYADLPKGYQITQDTTPICTGGFVNIKDKNGDPKTIKLTRIHMEEDSGKSIHDIDPFNTLIDLNRAGVALLEIVSEPDFRSGEEAYNYLAQIRKLVRYLDICDGNLEEGSMRCDANISVRLKGETDFRTRVEVKNMNSLRNVQRAIEVESKRQIEVYEAGGEIFQETHNYDAGSNTTVVMRSKEDAHDYRYFPEPDLQPVIVTEDYIKEVAGTLPPLPEALFDKYTKEYKLSEYDANNLTETKGIALYFEELIAKCPKYKAAANFMMGPIKSYMNEKAIPIEEFPVRPDNIAELVHMIDENKISHLIASQKLFPQLISEPTKSPTKIAEENNWLQQTDSNELEGWIQAAIDKFPAKVAAYKDGNKNLLGLFMGDVMRASGGTIDPKEANKMIREMLDKA